MTLERIPLDHDIDDHADRAVQIARAAARAAREHAELLGVPLECCIIVDLSELGIDLRDGEENAATIAYPPDIVRAAAMLFRNFQGICASVWGIQIELPAGVPVRRARPSATMRSNVTRPRSRRPRGGR
jgi:hypothetical protein